MDREEILKRSRSENEVYDEREKEINIKSSAIAKAFGLALGFILVFIEDTFLGTMPVASIAIFSVCFSMEAIESIFRFIYLKGKFNLIKSILFTIIALAFIGCLIYFFYRG